MNVLDIAHTLTNLETKLPSSKYFGGWVKSNPLHRTD